MALISLVYHFVCHPGGPFDLMSRRLITASSRAVAERIAKAITEFHVGRDDTDGLKTSSNSSANATVA